MRLGWGTCDLWLSCNWLNQNIKSLNNVKFEQELDFEHVSKLHKNLGNLYDLRN
jgi:hypothetical protein